MRWKNYTKKNGLAMILSFLIPVCILFISYFRMGIYPTSELTNLSSDGFVQLVNFYGGFNNVLHGNQSLFYTWTGSLGLNFVSLTSYYVNSIFSFLVYFFDNFYMPDAMYIILLTKIGAMSVSFWVYANHTYRLPQWMKVYLSSCYALMGYTVAYSIFLMWFDALFYLPLILLGIHQVMDKKNPILLFVSYFLLFISNYYVAFMVGVFTFLYYFARMATNFKRYKKSVFSYLVTSLLAGGASMIIILPSIIDLKANGEKLDSIKHFLTIDMGPWDIIVKSMPGVYDTSKYGSAPFIYVGLLSVMFCLFYFCSSKIPLKNRLIFGSLLVFMIASFYIEPLNLFWHGFHSPNMFLFRFSFLYSALVIILAGFGLESFEKKDLNKLLNISLFLIVIFVVAVILSNKKRYDYISQISLICTVILLVIYLVFYVLKDKVKNKSWLLPLLFLPFLLGEAFFNTSQLLEGIHKEWGYVARKEYAKDYKKIEALVKEAESRNNHFYRLENLNAVTLTDSFNYNYSGVTLFSSIRNRNSSKYLDHLGYRSTGTNLFLDYKNNTLVMDALLGIKYNLSKNGLSKFGFKKIKTVEDYALYENQNAMSLGVLTDKGIYKEEHNNDQEALIQYLSDLETPIYQATGVKEIERKNMNIQELNDFTYYSEETARENQSITWVVKVPEKTQPYLKLDIGVLDGMNEAKVIVDVEGKKAQGINQLDRSGSFYDLGYYEKAQTVKVKATFSGQPVIRLIRPSVLLLKIADFEQGMKEIKKKEVNFEVKGNRVETDVSLNKAQTIFTTIPYDHGWQAKIDGKITKVRSVQDALITLDVPKGKHKIQLVYYPKGMKLGSLLFVLCTLLFILYTYWNQKKIKKLNVEANT